MYSDTADSFHLAFIHYLGAYSTYALNGGQIVLYLDDFEDVFT